MQVGIIDLDICGPSVPKLLGVQGQSIVTSQYGWVPIRYMYVQQQQLVPFRKLRGENEWLYYSIRVIQCHVGIPQLEVHVCVRCGKHSHVDVYNHCIFIRHFESSFSLKTTVLLIIKEIYILVVWP